jgi:hypothetical protein
VFKIPVLLLAGGLVLYGISIASAQQSVTFTDLQGTTIQAGTLSTRRHTQCSAVQEPSRSHQYDHDQFS